MFARFRQVRDRLNVSLVEAARVGPEVRQSHVASLGSVPLPPSPADRVQFWLKAHRRLSTLSNKMDAEMREAVVAAIHARLLIPTAEDQEATKNSGKEANAALFAMLRDKHRARADAHRRGIEQETAAAKAVDGLEAAYASRTMTQLDVRRFLKSLGITAAELRHYRALAALCDAMGEDRIVPMLVERGLQAGDRARRRTVRSLRAASSALRAVRR